MFLQTKNGSKTNPLPNSLFSTVSSRIKPSGYLKPSPTATKIPPFEKWLPIVTSNYHWEWDHLRYICGQLDKVTDGLITRLMVFCPPQHGKSSLVTIRYPVWRLEREQTLRVIIAAYNQTRANEFSRDARRVAADRFPLNPE